MEVIKKKKIHFHLKIDFYRNKPSKSVTIVGSGRFIVSNDSDSPKMLTQIYLNFFSIFLKSFRVVWLSSGDLQAKEVFFFPGFCQQKLVCYSVVWIKEIMSLCTVTEAYSTEFSSLSPLKPRLEKIHPLSEISGFHGIMRWGTKWGCPSNPSIR